VVTSLVENDLHVHLLERQLIGWTDALEGRRRSEILLRGVLVLGTCAFYVVT
jgi:hypothetical protein